MQDLARLADENLQDLHSFYNKGLQRESVAHDVIKGGLQDVLLNIAGRTKSAPSFIL
jgi:hypothetical protein